MSQHVQPPQAASNHFDAAKIIVETLKALPKDQQALAMRFASETLGIQAPAIAPGSGSPNPASTPAGTPAPLGAPPAVSTIKQFTDLKAPKSDQQFAAVAAYFYRFKAPEGERKEAIDAETLKQAARDAERNQPGNAAMTLTNAKNAGYLDAAGRGKFTISAVGENLVAMSLPGSGADASSKRASGKKKKAKKKTGAKKAAKAGK